MPSEAAATIRVTAYDGQGRISELNDNQLVGIDRPWGLRLPPGRYWVGDPCYLFGGDHPDGVDREAWIQCFCNRIWNDTYGFGVFEFGGHRIPWSGTAHGDGRYPVFKREEAVGDFDVDAGLFCVVSLAFLEQWAADWLNGQCPDCGVWIELERRADVDFHPGVDSGGRMTVGDYVIDTDPPPTCESCGSQITTSNQGSWPHECGDCEEWRLECESEESET